MEQLVDSQHGSTVLLAGLLIILALHLVMKIAEYIKEWAMKKGEYTDQNRVDIIRMEHRFDKVDEKLEKLLKMERDLRRAFVGIKVIVGDKWPEVRKKIMEDDLT